MQSILLPDYLAARTQAQHSFSTCSVTQKTQHAERMMCSMHTGHTSGCLQLCIAQLSAVPVCFAKHSAASLPCCKNSGTAQIQHMQCDSDITACRAYDRQHAHRPHIRVSTALEYTAESNACLLCKAFCCLITLLQTFRHSTASAHAV